MGGGGGGGGLARHRLRQVSWEEKTGVKNKIQAAVGGVAGQAQHHSLGGGGGREGEDWRNKLVRTVSRPVPRCWPVPGSSDSKAPARWGPWPWTGRRSWGAMEVIESWK